MLKTRAKAAQLRKPERLGLPLALRYLRAAEAKQKFSYEVHIRLNTVKGAPPVRGSLRLPNAVKPHATVCVIAEGRAAEDARRAGATLAGGEDVVQRLQKETLQFDKYIAHPNCLSMLRPVARLLGQKGLMPSPKRGTVTTDIAQAVTKAMGQTDFRERMGVVRLGIGLSPFTDAQVQENVQAVLQRVREAAAAVIGTNAKITLDEVVLSSTRGPGIVI